MAEFFEATLAIHDAPKTVANWILRDVLQALRSKNLEIEDFSLTPEMLAGLVRLVDAGRLTVKNGREVFLELVEHGGEAESVMQDKGLEAVQDKGLIDRVVKEVLEASPDSIARFHEGDNKVLNFLMGQVMKATKGKANPAEVKGALERELRG